jgi:hypothetical protein
MLLVRQRERRGSLERRRIGIALRTDDARQRRVKDGRNIVQRNTILRAARPSDTRHHRAKVKLQDGAILRLGRIGLVEEPLGLHVGFDKGNPLFAAPRKAQVAQGLFVHREDATGCTILRGHIGNRRPVGQRQRGEARAKELDELTHDAKLAQLLSDSQHQIGSGGAFGQRTEELKAHHLRNEHRDRLTEHRGLGLNTTNAPTEYPHTIDHRRMAIGADERIGVGLHRARGARILITGKDDAGQVFQIDLVDNAVPWRHHLKILERGLAPTQEGIALLIPHTH